MMLSVLMPVYNEVSTLTAAVKAVLDVDYQCDMELVIVDDGSTDGTRELYGSLDIQSAGFGMEAEITGKLLRRGVRPYEIPISYRARSRAEGKKLTWRDGVEALWILIRERFRPVSS